MPTLVGQKGQVVIEKRIREKLAIKPKSLAIQTLVGDHIEVRFVPPAHDKSLAGSLKKFINPEILKIPLKKRLELEEKAWEEAVKKEWMNKEKH